VVDNASADGTPERLASAFGPSITIRRNQRNTGSAGGFAEGVRLALDQGAEAVWCLDQDARPRPGALAALLAALGSDPRAGAAGSRVLVRGAGELIQECGVRLGGWTGRLSHLGRGRTAPGFGAPRPVDALAYTSLLVRGEAVRRAGNIDPEFFLYYDDLEWTARIRNCGFRLLAAPGSVVEHADSALKPLTPERLYLVMRNRFRFFARAKRGLGRRWLLALQVAILDSRARWCRELRRAPEEAALAAALADGLAGRGGAPDREFPAPAADLWDGLALGEPLAFPPGAGGVHLAAGGRLDLALPALRALAALGVERERITLSASGFAADYLAAQGHRPSAPRPPFVGVVLDLPTRTLLGAARQAAFAAGRFRVIADYRKLLARHARAEARRQLRRAAVFPWRLLLG